MNTPNETTKSSRNVYITVILLTAMVVSFAVAGIAMAPVLAEQAREDEAAKIIEDKENAEKKAAEDKKKAAEEKAEDEKKAAEKAAEEEKKAEEKANEEKAAEEEKEAEEEAEKAAEEKKAEEEAERANITTPAEAFCNGLESDLTVMNLMVGRVDSGELTYEEAAYQAHSYAGNSCPDWLDPSLADDDYRKAFIGYLQGWNVIPGDIWAGV